MLRFCIILSVCGISVLTGYGFDFTKATWQGLSSTNERTKVRAETESGRQVIKLEVPASTEGMSFYAYADVKSGGRYRLTFRCEVEKLLPGNVPSAKTIIYFRGEDGKILRQGSEVWEIDLKEGETFVLKKEFLAIASRLQLVGLSLKNIGGKFRITECRLEEVSSTVKVVKGTPDIQKGVSDIAWRSAPELQHFYRVSMEEPADVETFVKICYDAHNLYLFFKCSDPEIASLKKGERQRDGKVWLDDGVEVWLAPESGRKMQLIMNCIGTIYDAELYQTAFGDPWKNNPAWNGNAKSFTEISADYWTGILEIPWSDLNFKPLAGNKLGINLVRARNGAAKEYSHWNRIDGKHSSLEKFGTLEFDKDFAILQRFREKFQRNPFGVNRANAEFTASPRHEKGKYLLCGLMHPFILSDYPPAFQEKNKDSWSAWQASMLNQMDAVGLHSPFILPWGEKWAGGKKQFDFFLQTHQRMKIPMALHNTSHDRAAISSKKALYFNDRFTNIADPATRNNILGWFRDYLSTNPAHKSRLLYVRGYDEPSNSLYNVFSKTKNPDNLKNLEELDRKIKQEFGFGKFGVFDNFADNSDTDAPFRRIAFLRWWNSEVVKSVQASTDIVRELLPEVPFMPIVSNTVTTFTTAEMVPLFAGIGDWHGIDPYPTATTSVYSSNRAVYTVGFNTKLHKDFLPAEKKLFVYIQAFSYHGRTPSNENMTEWTSQALKNGADILNWYNAIPESSPRIIHEALRLSKIINEMKPLKLPDTPRIAIYFSFPDAWGNFDMVQHPHYTVYSILGEHLKYWFKFVSDALPHDLSPYKLVVVPRYTYFMPERAEELIRYVKDGGTVLIFDPKIFAYNINGESDTALRYELLGFDSLKTVSAKNIQMNGESYPVMPGANIRTTESSGTFTLPPGAKTIGTYPDGMPAAMERPLGKGKVIYFAVQSFGNSDLAVSPGNWKNYFDSLIKNIGEKPHPAVWNFSLPFK